MTEIERYEAPQGQLVSSEPDVDSWVHVLAPVGDLAAKIAGTDFVPKDFRGKPAAVAGAILFGRELGLPPMTTLKNTYVVHGTPDLSAEAQRALVLAAGHEIEFEEVTATRCKMRGRRAGSEVWTQAQYTMDEAKQSGDFTKNGNYKTRPQEMLIARCTSRLCSMIFPDVTGGFSSAVNVPLVQGDDESTAAAEPTRLGMSSYAVFCLKKKKCQSLLERHCPNRRPSVYYTHLRATETTHEIVCRLLREQKKTNNVIIPPLSIFSSP